jgi:signal transduction histidine kinase
MRRLTWVLAVMGGAVLVLTAVIAWALRGPGQAAWALAGPGPFYAAGLWLALRRPGHAVAAWLLGIGIGFALEGCLGQVLNAIPASGTAWLLVMVRQWAGSASIISGVGLIGLFPTGRPRHTGEGWTVGVVTAALAALPFLHGVSHPHMATGVFPDPDEPSIDSPLFQPDAAVAGPLIEVLRQLSPLVALAGVAMLYLRYRTGEPGDRRRIRWLLAGMICALGVWSALLLVAWTWDGAAVRIAAVAGWPFIVLLSIGSVLAAVTDDGVVGIDLPWRRAVVYRVMWVLIALAHVAAAAALGMLATRILSVGTAVLLAAAAMLLFQPVRRRLERTADSWVFGERLDGYQVIMQFSASLRPPQPAGELLPALAAAVRRGLRLGWARVQVDVAEAGRETLSGTDGPVPEKAEPALVMPLIDGDSELGRIECGPRVDGPLLTEDRRLLEQLAGQAAAAVRNIHLSAQLGAQLDVIRDQAAQLSASRARIVAAQDAERQRIQRDLHDGVQQDLVVLTARLATARERLRRGDPGAGDLLAEVQRDLAILVGNLREFAHDIHPPVLADRGLLQAVEAQAARMPIEVAFYADPGLRGVRFPPEVETAAWYLLTEALTNAVKHSGASRVSITLRRDDRRLAIEVRDNGCGFDPATARGLGMSSLADRASIVDGTLHIDSAPGRGTRLRAQIPLARSENTHA